MTEDEYQNLLTELGKNKTIKCIEQLDIYKKSKGVEYVDDYATIKRWVIDRVEEIEKKQVKENKKIIIKILVKENIQIIFLILFMLIDWRKAFYRGRIYILLVLK